MEAFGRLEFRSAAFAGGRRLSMSVLARYIIRSVMGYTLLVMSVFVILSGLYLFMTQQDEIGVGNYHVLQALLVVICRLPGQIFDLLPIGALIAALLALGNLARSSELVVMRAAGVSVFRLAAWVGVAGVMLTVITWVLGDYVAPPLGKFAQEQKALAKYSEFSSMDGRGLWAKDGNTFVFVQGQSGDAAFGGVYVLKFDDEHRLLSVARAESAIPGKGQEWSLKNYAVTQFTGDRTQVTRQDTASLSTKLSSEFLVTDPEALSGRELYSYIRYMRSNQFDTREFEVTLWARVARTAALCVIVMLAVPFAFGPMRSTGAGARTVVGILIGASFFLLAKLLVKGGDVFDLHPLVIAWAPTAVLAAITTVAIARVR